MNIYILRHGLAGDRDSKKYPDDSQRPLTSEGEDKLWKIAKGMKNLGLKFGLILSSPYLRTRQTAEIVAEAFDAKKKLELTETLEPDGLPSELIKLLNHRQSLDSPLLVGHEPYLSSLISVLISGDRHSSVTMKKGGFCKLSVDSLKYDYCGSLRWVLTPKQLTLLG